MSRSLDSLVHPTVTKSERGALTYCVAVLIKIDFHTIRELKIYICQLWMNETKFEIGIRRGQL